MVKQPAQVFAIHTYEILFGMRHLDTRTRAILIKGKLRRLFYTTFHKDYVEYSLNLRKSECGRSGVCCLLGYPCPNLGKNDQGTPYCRIHDHRPENCRIFPLDWEDVVERDLMAGGESICGYDIPKQEEHNFQKFQAVKKQQKKRESLARKRRLKEKKVLAKKRLKSIFPSK